MVQMDLFGGFVALFRFMIRAMLQFANRLRRRAIFFLKKRSMYSIRLHGAFDCNANQKIGFLIKF